MSRTWSFRVACRHVAASLLAIAACSTQPTDERWTLVLQRGSQYLFEGPFDSLAECQDEADARKRADPALSDYHECGLNCRGRVCEKTLR